MDDGLGRTVKVAGGAYLLTMLSANFAEFYIRHQLFVHGDSVQTVRNIGLSMGLFRIGIATDAVTLASDVVLIVALSVILKPFNRIADGVAVFWRLLGCFVAAAALVNSVAAFFLLSAHSVSQLSIDQLRAWAGIFVSVDTAASRINALFFGLGSTLFCYLWLRSRYIPRALAGFGIFASLVPAIIPFTAVMTSVLVDAPLRRARSGIPIMIFEFVLGFWLLVKGVKEPVEGDASGPLSGSDSLDREANVW